MSRFARLLILLVPLALGLASRALPGRAQTAPVSSRFAFSDTTLLRDTLDLSFGQLFPLADSLRMTPDSLRALSIRYLMPIERLVFLSDSLRMPVDSVGSVMRRAEFNPLASRVQQLSAFAYGSSYNVSRQTNTWTNRADYNFVHGPLFLHNATNISIRRTSVGSRENLYQVRSADTEAGWRFSPNFSAGGRIGIQGTQNVEATTRNTSRSQYQVSVHTRQQPSPSLSSEIDFFGGPFDEPSASKRGMSGELDAHSAFMHRDWLTHDITGRVNSRFGHATFVDGSKTGTQDVTGEVTGALAMFDARKAGLRVNYGARYDRFSRPLTIDADLDSTTPPVNLVRLDPNSSANLDGTFRYRPNNDLYLNVTQSYGRSRSLLSITRNGIEVLEPSPAHSLSLSSDGRYTFRGWALDGRFTNGYPVSEGPKSSLVSVVHQGVTDTIVQIPVDYRERASSHNRSLDLALNKALGRRLALKLTHHIELTSYRYRIADTSYVQRYDLDSARVEPTEPSEYFRKSYRAEGSYTQSANLSTGLSFEINDVQNINLLGTSSESNTDVRTYRSEWRWSFRLLRGLTASQRNVLNASYQRFPFRGSQNALGLTYETSTTLNAVLTPRFLIDITHRVQTQPSGQYLLAVDGHEYLVTTSENRNYTLLAHVAYSPLRTLTLSLDPYYNDITIKKSNNGPLLMSSGDRSLSYEGGASLNFPVGQSGKLTGSIVRSYRAFEHINYTNGLPQPPSRSSDPPTWVGTLQFSWDLQ
jgi:hypothetical protein